MFRIDDPTASGGLPPPGAAGTEGYFVDGTKVTHDWANMIQEEVRAAVVAGGLAPSKTDHTQLAQAIAKLIALAQGNRRQTVLTANHTFALADAGGLFVNGSGANTWTVPDDAAVSFLDGTEIKGVNDSASALTIAIGADTIWWPGGSGGGAGVSRTIADHGVFILTKYTQHQWVIEGDGVT